MNVTKISAGPNVNALTGRMPAVDLREGFWTHSDMGGCMDAPRFILTGSTRKNHNPLGDNVDYVIADITWRD